jgi:UDP-glucose 4-epimerase
MSVYGDGYKYPVMESSFCKPLSCYGTSKYASESYLRVYGDRLPTVTLRMFNVYGPGQDLSNLRQGMVSLYLSQALQNGKIEVKGSSERFRDFIFIDDVVETWFRAANSEVVIGKTLNVGTGVKTLIGELLELICQYVPNSTYFSKGSTPGDQNGIYADTSNLSLYLGMDSFTPLRYGLQKFVVWAKSQK